MNHDVFGGACEKKLEQADAEARRAALLEPLLQLSAALRRNGEADLARYWDECFSLVQFVSCSRSVLNVLS